MRKALALGLTLLATAAPALAGQPDEATVPLAVLERPATAADAPPRAIVRDSAVRASNVDAASFRLALTDRGRRYFVARTGDAFPDAVCLVDVAAARKGGRPTGGIHCASAQTVRRAFLITRVALHGFGDGVTADVVGVVPDGVTEVAQGRRAVGVAGNVFILRRVDPRRPVLAYGPGLARERVLQADEALHRRLGEPMQITATLSPRGTPQAGELISAPFLADVRRRGSLVRDILLPGQRSRWWLAPRPGGRIVSFVDTRDIVDCGGSEDAVAELLSWPVRLMPVSISTVTVPDRDERPQRRDVTDLAGVAPDGVTRVRLAGALTPVVRNTFVFRDLPRGTVLPLDVSGPLGRRRVWVDLHGPTRRSPLPTPARLASLRFDGGLAPPGTPSGVGLVADCF